MEEVEETTGALRVGIKQQPAFNPMANAMALVYMQKRARRNIPGSNSAQLNVIIAPTQIDASDPWGVLASST
jgi:hypothetical protein